MIINRESRIAYGVVISRDQAGKISPWVNGGNIVIERVFDVIPEREFIIAVKDSIRNNGSVIFSDADYLGSVKSFQKELDYFLDKIKEKIELENKSGLLHYTGCV